MSLVPLATVTLTPAAAMGGASDIGRGRASLEQPTATAQLSTAASRLSAAHRGRSARKHLTGEREAARTIAAVQRGRSARNLDKQQQNAAKVIQTRIRGSDARRRVTSYREPYYFTPSQVKLHDRIDDLWVSRFGLVLNLTKLVDENRGELAQPIIEAAGEDISHWFDPHSRHLRTYIHPDTLIEQPYLPMGRFIHVPPSDPSASWSSAIGTPWWIDSKYVVGRLTKKTRLIKLFNMLTQQETVLEVCSEETLTAIRRRVRDHNSHIQSYVWKRTDHNGTRVLDMEKTLDGNGIMDDSADLDALGIDETFIPLIYLYFSDDLTVA